MEDLDNMGSISTEPGQQQAVNQSWAKTVAVMEKHRVKITVPCTTDYTAQERNRHSAIHRRQVLLRVHILCPLLFQDSRNHETKIWCT